MPSRRKSFAVSLLPMPIDPVSPTMRGSRELMERLFQISSYRRRYLWRSAEEGFERRGRLEDQHREAIDCLQPPATSLPQQSRLQRIVDEVANQGSSREPGERKVQRASALHSCARRVDEERCCGPHGSPFGE